MDLPFQVHFDVLAVAAGLVALYELGILRLADAYCPEDEHPVTGIQRGLFYAGVIILVLVSAWPIHDIAEGRLFLFHMIEHMALAVIVPPLLLAGTPWWLTRVLVTPIMPLVKFITRPVIALVLFNAWLAFIHVPAVVELMITNELFHFFAHAALFAAAIIMWWPVLDPIPDTKRLTPFGKMGYLFFQSLVPTIPASFMTLGSTPLYEIYGTFPRLWGIDVMTDQIAAGLIMKIGGGLIIWGFITWIFFSWYAEEQKHEPGPVLVVDQQ
ncbi:MAG: cytochrome c oxidase assembly factor CtaG [Acidimicrobiia bacterium]|nr:MAG: cytochrome c oxidase assembly factor CtaG [Acidimicrobiia bacterium]